MGVLNQLWLSLFFGKRFYRLMTAVIFLFVLSYGFSFLFNFAVMALALVFLGLVLDYSVLYSKRNPAFVQRILPDRLSNGEVNTMYWQLQNQYPFRARIQLIDEFPEVWQLRDFTLKTILEPGDKKLFHSSSVLKRGRIFLWQFAYLPQNTAPVDPAP
jgi:hypothetical protein